MLHLPRDDQLICLALRRNKLCKLWFHELIVPLFLPTFLSTEAKYLLQNLQICVTQGIFRNTVAFWWRFDEQKD